MKRVKQTFIIFIGGMVLQGVAAGYVAVAGCPAGCLLGIFYTSILFSCICIGFVWWFLNGLRRNIMFMLDSKQLVYTSKTLFSEDINLSLIHI